MPSTDRPQKPAAGERREVKGFCTFCKSRCGSINVVENGRLVAVKPDPSHPTGQALCPKGRAAPEIVHSADRLLYPMRRSTPKGAADPGWTRVSWDEALDEIAARLTKIKQESGPEALVCAMVTASAGSISDVRAWIERFVFAFGSRNIWASAELCAVSEIAHAITLGRALGTPDVNNSELIVFWGHNPSNTWLALATAAGAAQARGAKLAVVDPRRTSMAGQADFWLRVRPGADAMLALAAARVIVDEKLYNEDFVRRWTNAPLLVRADTGKFLRASELGLGSETQFVVWDERRGGPKLYDTMLAAPPDEAARFALSGAFDLQTPGGAISVAPVFALYRQQLQRFSLADAAEACGVPADDLVAFARALGRARSACYFIWTGVGQHDNATQIDRAIATLFALKGQVAAPGGNVDWAVPKLNSVNDPAQLMSAEQYKKILGMKARPLGPSLSSWVDAQEVYKAILEHDPYPVRAVLAFGSNPLVSRFDPELGRQALSKLDLHVHCDIFPNPTADCADFLLPACSAWEREALRVGFEVSAEAESLAQLRPAMIDPVGESRSDLWIAAELAKRLGMGEILFEGDTERAFNYMLAPSGLTTADLRAHPGGVRLPVEDSYYSYAKETPAGVRGFETPTRRVELYSEQLLDLGQPPLPDPGSPRPPDPDYPLLLTNTKYGHFNHTQHRQIAGLRRRSTAPIFYLAEETAAARRIEDGDVIEIRTPRASMTALAQIESGLRPDTVIGQFGWWQACDDLGEPAYPVTGPGTANFNVLVDPDRTDPVMNTPRVRSIECQIERVAAASLGWSGFKPLRVAATHRETDAVSVIELESADGKPLPRHKPGQFISIDPDGSGTVRSYSLINAAEAVQKRYAVGVKREPGGAISSRLAGLKPGDIVQATRASGRFTLPTRNAHPVCLIAYGIGVTPFMSLLETLTHVADGPEVWMWHCAPTPESQPFRARLLELESALPRFTLLNHLSRGTASDATATCDRPQRFTVEAIPAELIARRARFYVCGAPQSLEHTKAALLARGVPNFEIFLEKFESPRLLRTDADKSPRRITLMRSARELVWPGQGSILDALLDQGVAAPSGCRVGQCESCALRLVEGDVHYLTPPENIDAGECLTCCSYPITDIALDI